MESSPKQKWHPKFLLQCGGSFELSTPGLGRLGMRVYEKTKVCDLLSGPTHWFKDAKSALWLASLTACLKVSTKGKSNLFDHAILLIRKMCYTMNAKNLVKRSMSELMQASS